MNLSLVSSCLCPCLCLCLASIPFRPGPIQSNSVQPTTKPPGAARAARPHPLSYYPPHCHHASCRPGHHVIPLVHQILQGPVRVVRETHRAVPAATGPCPPHGRVTGRPSCPPRHHSGTVPGRLWPPRGRPRAGHVDLPARRSRSAGRLRLLVPTNGWVGVRIRGWRREE